MRTNPRVLVIDDDRMVRDYMRVVLQRSDFEVMAPDSATEALSVIEQSDPGIDAVVSDVDMPDMNGFAFAQAVIRRFPRMPVLMVSGNYPECDGDGRFAFLQKPFGPAALAKAVGRLLTV